MESCSGVVQCIPVVDSCVDTCCGFLQWGLLHLSPAVESCSGESYSGVLQWSVMQMKSLSVEFYRGVLQWSLAVESYSGLYCSEVSCS